MQIEEWLQLTIDTLVEICNIVAEFIQSITESLAELADRINTFFEDEYKAAGQPYGSSRKGMQRWLVEITEAYRLQRQASYILMRHELLASVRRNL